MAMSDLIRCTTEVDNRPVSCRILAPHGASGEAPVLLLHGLGCSSEVWMPALWALAQLDSPRLAVAPDFPGYGHSADPDHVLGIGELADWACRLMDRLGIPCAHVAAHSMGCQVALAMAHRAPERVKSMILIGPTLGRDIVPPWRYAAGLFADIFVEKMLYNGLLAKMYCQMGVGRYCATTAKMFADRPLEYAGEIACPTLVIRGQYDAIVPDTSARRLAAKLPYGRYERIGHTAHAVLFNRPELFAARLASFLADVEADASPWQTDAEPPVRAWTHPMPVRQDTGICTAAHH